METTESQTEQAPAVETKPQENFESKYKEMQAKYEQQLVEYRKVQETLDAVTPYVKWDNQTVEDDTYVSKKEVNEQIKNVSGSAERKILELQFLVNHPELKDYKDTLVAPTILRMRSKFPLKPIEDLLEEAAKDVNNFIESERKKGEQRIKEEKAKADAEAMSGLESSGVTPKKVEEPAETLDDYVAQRTKIVNKKKGY